MICAVCSNSIHENGTDDMISGYCFENGVPMHRQCAINIKDDRIAVVYTVADIKAMLERMPSTATVWMVTAKNKKVSPVFAWEQDHLEIRDG